MRSFSKSMLIPFFAMALSALAFQACGPGTETGGGRCTPGDAKACTCTGTDVGVQSCLPTGAGYDKCVCGGSGGAGGAGGSSSGTAGAGGGNCHVGPNIPTTCGNGVPDPGEECDDNNCNPADLCNNDCKKPYCGDKVVQFPETCDGGEQCDADCKPIIIPNPDVVEAGGPCDGKLIFAGFAAAQLGAFSYNGQIGLDAATAACQALGGFGMCDYDQWKQIQTSPVLHPADVNKLLMLLPTNGACQDVWLQRTSIAGAPEAAACPNMMAPFGPGGNCNNWNYQTTHVADGEHVNICNTAGTITFDYKIDCDPVFDANNPGPHQDQTLPCNVMHPIPCCYEKCVNP